MPPIMTDICAASLFNEDVKLFKDIIVKDIRVLLNYHHDNQSNKYFTHLHVLQAICKEMFMSRFYDHHHHDDHGRGMRTDGFADDQRYHFETAFRILRHKWKSRFTANQHLTSSSSEWVQTL